VTSVGLSALPWTPPASPGGDTTSTIGLSVSQVLWNGYPGGPAQASVDKSLLSLQGAELSTQSSRLALIYSVKQAYYAVLSAQSALTVKQAILEEQNSLLKQIQAIYDMKQASAVDLKTAQLNARSAQVDVDSANNDLRVARSNLALLMGQALDRQFSVAAAPDPTVPTSTVQEAIATGLAQRVEIKQIDLSMRSSKVDLQLARGQATPTISVSGALNWLFDWNGTNAAGGSAAVRVSLPILDAGAAANQVAAAERQIDVYTLQEQQQVQSITLAVRNAWEAVQLANEKRDLAQLSEQVNELQYQIVKTKFDNGTASGQDLLTASVNSANARNAYQAAVSAAQLAVLQLQSVMGD
jgi:outer membrane protein